MVFEGIEALEDTVVEMFFAQFVPEMFLGIQFGRIWRQEQQAQIVGQAEATAFVPAGAIEHHDQIVARVAAGNLVEEDLHAVGVDMRQHQAVEATVPWTDRAIGVGILLRHHGANERPGGTAAPAIAGVRDASESGFVLEHQPQWPTVAPGRYDFAQHALEFFFQSSRTAASPFG